MTGEQEPRKPQAGDYLHALVRGGLAAVPYVGGTLAELFSAIILPPLERRRQQWLESTGQRLLELERRVEGFRIERLAEDPLFLTIVLQATQVALRSHEEAKLAALRAAVLNTALRVEPDEALAQMFVAWIDSFTPWHIRILAFFDGPSEWAAAHGLQFSNVIAGSPGQVLVRAFPVLSGNEDFYRQVVKDLHGRGLLGIDSLNVMMTPQGMLARRTTDLGRRFLAFIHDPESGGASLA